MEEDCEKAFRWFYNAAVQGDSDSQFVLGTCYEDGIGVEADLTEAREWYGRAAEQGHREAKKALKKLR